MPQTSIIILKNTQKHYKSLLCLMGVLTWTLKCVIFIINKNSSNGGCYFIQSDYKQRIKC
jgi:hypothetical protein